MRYNKSKEILNYFVKNASHPLSARELANTFNISERQVKNYIRQINQETRPEQLLIQTPTRKYRLHENYRDYLHLFQYQEDLPKNRVNTIISMLLLAEAPVDLFDLADELYISRPTLESDLTKIRRILSDFHLTLHLKNDCISLSGEEIAKRRLTSHMISSDQYSEFMGDNKLKYLNNLYKATFIKQNLKTIFEECNFLFNDYSLNNIVLHLIITIDRLKRNYQLEEVLSMPPVTDIEQHAAKQVASFLEKNFNITFSDIELQNLMLFLSCNLTTPDYSFANTDKLTAYISDSTHDLVRKILQGISEYYYLNEFDDAFITRFALHISNMLKRMEYHFSFRSPLTAEIKHTYPLIYDIAVFAAEIIDSETGYLINQDEIALIALHIGGFLETKELNKNKFTALYIYSDYHSIYKHNIVKILKRYDDVLNIQYSISVNDYLESNLKADFIFSEYPLLQYSNVIQISPFITDKELDLIQEKIRSIQKGSSVAQFRQDLTHLFGEQLFFTDLYAENEFDVIRMILDRLKESDLFFPEFPEEVIKREQISSTCFHNGIAIPHAISQQVKKSFISFTCLEKGQNWNGDTVFLVIVIGISYEERKIFRTVFDQLIEILADNTSVQILGKCKNYTDIMESLTTIVQNL